MWIFEKEKQTFLYLNGIRTPRNIRIGENAELLTAEPSYNQNVLNSFRKSDVSYGLALMFLPLVSSQIKLSCDDSKKLTALAWNSQWDAVLLGALFDCEIGFNFQSNSSISELKDDSRVDITNYHLRGLSKSIYDLSLDEADWLEENFQQARTLLDIKEFFHATHCLSTYRWHTYPGAQLAIIWSGIESLFKIESEVIFRLSLYISLFLEPDDKAKREELFKRTKILYKQRSAAVHGSKIKGDAIDGVRESAGLLSKILYECINNKSIPKTEILAP